MTTLMRTEIRSVWSEAAGIERVAYAIAAALTVSGIAHFLVLVVSGGSWEGPLSFRKPTTFGVSFGLTLGTITWVASYVRMSARTRGWLLGFFSAACVAEVALVTFQAWRGVPSHYNLETLFDGVIARTLAVGGAVLVVVIAILTILALRSAPDVAPSMRLAVRAGLLCLDAALGIGVAMIAKGLLLVFAGQQQLAYATGGALKPEHAVTMHAVLVLPALAWLLTFTPLTERRRGQVVWLGIAGYALAAVIVVLNLA
jgi:hypothetical protein